MSRFCLIVISILLFVSLEASANSIVPRLGTQSVYGKSQDLLNSTAFLLDVEYTPDLVHNTQSWLVEKGMTFLEGRELISEVGYMSFSGTEYDRKTQYLFPSLHIRQTWELKNNQQLIGQGGVGVGALFVKREDFDETQFTSILMASLRYRNLNWSPNFSVGLETGWIFDNEYPVSYNGIFISYQFNP